MNINVILGVISFVLWSIFSSWFYVNYIKEFDYNAPYELAAKSTKEEKFEDKSNTKETIKAPALVKSSKSFTFHKNTAVLIHPAEIIQFTDSLQKVIKDTNLTVSITGYTCDLGSDSYNYHLGQLRATFVMNTLKKSSINWPEMNVHSEGESKPLVPNISEINRTKNRRVNIIITPKQ